MGAGRHQNRPQGLTARRRPPDSLLYTVRPANRTRPAPGVPGAGRVLAARCNLQSLGACYFWSIQVVPQDQATKPPSIGYSVWT